MDYTARNYLGIPFAKVRARIDPPFVEALFALDAAYYGPLDEDGHRVPGTGWINGKSSPWNGHDKQATLAESKALFDQLHAALHAEYALAFWEETGKPSADLTPAEEAWRAADIAPDTGRPITATLAQEALDKLPEERRAAVAAAMQKGAETAAAKSADRARGKTP